MQDADSTRAFRAKACLWLCRVIIPGFWLLWPFSGSLTLCFRKSFSSLAGDLPDPVIQFLEVDLLIFFAALPIAYTAVILFLLPVLLYQEKLGFTNRLRYIFLAVVTLGILPSFRYWHSVDQHLKQIAAKKSPN